MSETETVAQLQEMGTTQGARSMGTHGAGTWPGWAAFRSYGAQACPGRTHPAHHWRTTRLT